MSRKAGRYETFMMKIADLIKEGTSTKSMRSLLQERFIRKGIWSRQAVDHLPESVGKLQAGDPDEWKNLLEEVAPNEVLYEKFKALSPWP